MTAISSRRIPSRSQSYRRAVRIVSRWAEFYTRDLHPEAAAERRDELASDLWEQGSSSDTRGASSTATGASILWRAVRGIPADLSWRRSHASGLGVGDAHLRGWSGRGSFAVAVVIAAAVLAFTLLVAVRVAIYLGRELPIPGWSILGPVALGAILLVCAMLLLLRGRTRWLGAFWLAAMAPGVLFFATRAMFGVSATFQWFRDGAIAFGPSWWAVPAFVCLGALALFYVALGIAWFPERVATEVEMTR